MQSLGREPQGPDGAYSGPVSNLTVRLPRDYHDRLKATAKAQGYRTSDYYIAVLDEFIRNGLQRHTHLFAVTNDAVPVSISAPSDLIELVRDKARSRRVGANELIFTAIAHHLDDAAAA